MSAEKEIASPSGIVGAKNADTGSSSLPIWERGWFVPALIVTGFAPLVYWHLVGMLAKPHYQFILFMPAGFWLLSMWDEEDVFEPRRPRPLIGLLITLTGWLALVLATWAWSPWIATVAALLAVLGLLLRSNFALGKWGPVFVFCFVFVPLPFGLDEDLIIHLRTVTTKLTSGVLDETGVLHQTYANVVKLPSKSLFIADACSGIHSLYVLMAFALFLTLYLRRSVLHSLFLLGSTLGLVLIENVVRIATVAWALRYSRDLSEGTPHTLLGVILFLGSALLVISLDQLFAFLLPAAPFEFLRRVFRKGQPVIEPMGNASEPARLTFAWLALSVLFAPLALAQIWNRPPAAPRLASLMTSDFEVTELGIDAMPEEMQGFERESYEVIRRVEGDPFGRSSQRWLYRKARMNLSLSVDYPYDNIKDLCLCYTSTGWTVSGQKMASADSLASDSSLESSAAMADGLADKRTTASPDIATAEISRELFGNGYLVFSSFDLDGNVGALIKEIAKPEGSERVTDRIAMFSPANREIPLQAANPPYIQIHLFARTHASLNNNQRRELVRFFIEARKRLTPKILRQVALDSTEDAAISEIASRSERKE